MPLCLRKGGAMGEPNNALNTYMNRPDRLRSVLEYYLGEKLPDSWKIEEEEGFYSARDSKGRISFRQRDRIKKVKAEGFSFLLGLENQYSINLIYPWRLMELDCRAYGLQIEKFQKQNISETEIRSLPLKLCELFGDYRVHLIQMRSIPDAELGKMDSDLKYVLGLMKRTRSRKKYEAYILENETYFSRIPKSAVDVIDACTNIRNIKEHLHFESNGAGEEEADMCKALYEIEKHAERQGKKEGIKQGENRLGSLMEVLLADGRTEDARLAAVDETARKRFYQEYGIA